MLQYSKIEIHKKNGTVEEITSFSSISISKSINAKVSTFSFSSDDFEVSEKLDKINVGDIVKIYTAKQDETLEHIFTGIIDKLPRKLNGLLKSFSFSGYDLLYGTQQILVNESYVGVKITDIIQDLLIKYGKYKNLSLGTLIETDYKANVGFSNKYLYDILESLCESINYNFHCDKEGKIHFYPQKTLKNPVPIKEDEFFKGSADFSFDNSRLVNHLRLVSNTGLSNDTEENFIIDESMIEQTFFELKNPPRVSSKGKIEMYIDFAYYQSSADTYIYDSMELSTGILGITEEEVDVLINFSEKKLITIPNDLIQKVKNIYLTDTKNFSIRIIYRYDYPIIDEIRDTTSISKYGIFSEVLINHNLTTRTELRQFGKNHLRKYSKPLITGSLETWKTNYDIAQLVNVSIETSNGYFMNDELLITSISYDIEPNFLSVKITFEEGIGVEDIVSDILTRIEKLEENNQNNEIVEAIEFQTENILISDLVKLIEEVESKVFVIGKSKIGDKI